MYVKFNQEIYKQAYNTKLMKSLSYSNIQYNNLIGVPLDNTQHAKNRKYDKLGK